jgi:DNA sulfur modification protein DndB
MKELHLPALRGAIGDWAFYCCLMKMRDVAERVSFANELQSSKTMSEFIQRELQTGRAKDITKYLQTQPQRFFNSLVVAVYGGDPHWFALGSLTRGQSDLQTDEIDEDHLRSVGFLRFSGAEKIFAIDGQHRLAGIKRAIDASDGETSIGDEDVSLVLVGHRKTKAGVERSRRLFTTLNKTARPVSKMEIIALDEDDVMAITCRRLVEGHKWFGDGRILLSSSSNLPAREGFALTTIDNLYDLLQILYTKILARQQPRHLKYSRPSDETLGAREVEAIRFFELLAEKLPEIGQYFRARGIGVSRVVSRHRNDDGGSILFRPAGLRMTLEVLGQMVTPGDWNGVSETLDRIALLDRSLDQPPFVNVLWDPIARRMMPQNRIVARDVVAAMLRGRGSKPLTQRYTKLTGESAAAVRELIAFLPSA